MIRNVAEALSKLTAKDEKTKNLIDCAAMIVGVIESYESELAKAK